MPKINAEINIPEIEELKKLIQRQQNLINELANNTSDIERVRGEINLKINEVDSEEST